LGLTGLKKAFKRKAVLCEGRHCGSGGGGNRVGGEERVGRVGRDFGIAGLFG